MASEDPGVWVDLYTQLPTAVRFILGALSFGLLTLVVWLYRRERETARRIETQLHARIDRLEEHTAEQFSDLRKDFNAGMREMNGNLIHIAQNTSRGEQ